MRVVTVVCLGLLGASRTHGPDVEINALAGVFCAPHGTPPTWIDRVTLAARAADTSH